jgi:hypothetical protein
VDETLESDSAGRYLFRGLPAATYTFEVSKRDGSGEETHIPVSEGFILQSHQSKEVFLKAVPGHLSGAVTGRRLGESAPSGTLSSVYWRWTRTATPSSTL